MLYNIKSPCALARVKNILYLCPLFVGWCGHLRIIEIDYKQTKI